MKKAAIIGLVVLLGLAITGAAYARWDDWGFGHWRDTDIEAVKNFQKETLSLRDELIIKRLELHKEYHSAQPNTDRITTLRKEIVDLQGKIQVVADKYGVSTMGPIGRKAYGMKKHSRAHGSGYHCPYSGQGPGNPGPLHQ